MMHMPAELLLHDALLRQRAFRAEAARDRLARTLAQSNRSVRTVLATTLRTLADSLEAGATPVAARSPGALSR